jgi:hypothetical protein
VAQRLAPSPGSPDAAHSLSNPSHQPRWNKQFFVQLAWILVTVLAVCGILVGTALGGLCHVAENRSFLFYSRCDSPIRYLPMTGLLVLIVGYVIAHLADMPWVRAMAILGALVPLLITNHLFAV